jgi:sec-independent protein translocase protein TatC
MFYWANEIYIYLAEPLTRHLPEDANMIAIDVASPFLTPFKLVLMLAVFLAMPVILYQMWAFVAPGLYANEKRIAGPLLVSSILLFYAGVAFAYYVVFPLVFGFFTSIGPEIVNISTDIGRYLDFVLALFFGFGLAFEVPIATIILVAIGFTTPKKLSEKRPYVIVGAFICGMLLTPPDVISQVLLAKRPYVIVGAFICGMLLTPPDVISQVLLALPMWVLFEAGLIASTIMFKDRDAEEEEDDLEQDASSDNPLTDEEMGAELDQAEADEAGLDKNA